MASTRKPKLGPARIDVEEDFEPIVISAEPTAEEDKLVLFYVGDEPYSVPRRPRPHIALRYISNARKHGDTAALDILLEDMLGVAGAEALRNAENITDDQMSEVLRRVQVLAMGSIKEGRGNS